MRRGNTECRRGEIQICSSKYVLVCLILCCLNFALLSEIGSKIWRRARSSCKGNGWPCFFLSSYSVNTCICVSNLILWLEFCFSAPSPLLFFDALQMTRPVFATCFPRLLCITQTLLKWVSLMKIIIADISAAGFVHIPVAT